MENRMDEALIKRVLPHSIEAGRLCYGALGLWRCICSFRRF